jgi:hypothetical protein
MIQRGWNKAQGGLGAGGGVNHRFIREDGENTPMI